MGKTAQRLLVELGARGYEIVVGGGLIAGAGAEIAPLLRRRQVVVVTDTNVAAHYLEPLRASLAAAGIAPETVVLPAGETIEEIFTNRGERVFREGERRVVLRLLAEPVHVLATGGGAFLDPLTRAAIVARGVSVWLRADLDVLSARVARRSDRPLLKAGDPRAILAELIERRYPVYAEAELVVDSGEGSPEATAARVIAALADCPLAAMPPAAEDR